jgi:hypothetical protein
LSDGEWAEDYGFKTQSLARRIMPTTRISINRAPVLTLWAAVVAEHLGFTADESLTLGKALAGLNAQAKGRRLGTLRGTHGVKINRLMFLLDRRQIISANGTTHFSPTEQVSPCLSHQNRPWPQGNLAGSFL